MEVPVAVIAIERVVLVGKVCNVQRGPSGVVVVADGDAHGRLLGAVFADGGAGFQADLIEFSVALIFVEEVRRGIVGDVDVGPAGVVEIRPHDA